MASLSLGSAIMPIQYSLHIECDNVERKAHELRRCPSVGNSLKLEKGFTNVKQFVLRNSLNKIMHIHTNSMSLV